MTMHFLVLALIVTTFVAAGVQACGLGEFYVEDNRICYRCPENTYMDEDHHEYSECKKCLEPDSARPEEYVAEPCTSSMNTRLLCKGAYFRVNNSKDPSYGSCRPCSQCGVGKYESLPYMDARCSNYTDTICLERPSTESTVNLTTGTTSPPTTTETATRAKKESGGSDIIVITIVVVVIVIIIIIVAVSACIVIRRRGKKGEATVNNEEDDSSIHESLV